MKIYVAGKWEEKAKISKIINKLESLGHEITWDWTKENPKDPPKKNALHDYVGVLDCDLIIVVALRDHMYRGSMTEMGIALAKGKTVWVVGHAIDNNIFIHLINKQFNNLQDMYDCASLC